MGCQIIMTSSVLVILVQVLANTDCMKRKLIWAICSELLWLENTLFIAINRLYLDNYGSDKNNF